MLCYVCVHAYMKGGEGRCLMLTTAHQNMPSQKLSHPTLYKGSREYRAIDSAVCHSQYPNTHVD